jgi:uncharacterized membrane protein (DUF4010 family)
MDRETMLHFGAALGVGILLGLERERNNRDPDTRFAGVRTFAIISLLGGVAAYMEQSLGLAWVPLAVFAGLAALVVTAYVATSRKGDLGLTTEISALLTYLLGALCLWGRVELAAALGVTCLFLLALKDWLHRIARRIQPEDIEATLKFTTITLIILPLLPNENFGPAPLKVINPYKIWLMVVLISGINFLSYILVKIVGGKHGVGLTGLLGGLVSSTAATLGFAQRSRREPELARSLAMGIILAWTVMFFRVPVEVLAVNRPLAFRLLIVLAGLAAVSLFLCFLLWQKQKKAETGEVPTRSNPFELWAAIRFGLLFAVINFGAKAAEVYIGEYGLYVAGAIAGLTDVDAITLSMANLALEDPERAHAAARTVLIAVLSNTVAKGAMALVMGSDTLRRSLALPTAILVGAGVAALFLA